MREFFCHLFLPRYSNNHRSKVLHHQSIFSIILLLFVVWATLGVTKTQYPQVLGVSIDMSVQSLLSLTNKDRAEQGLALLSLNEKLSQAATMKASDMLTKDYWAHYAPDGTTPWIFIQKTGYSYEYAGENLARGFTTSTDTVQAWMASPSHRENMLSPKYTDVGFAVKEGKLGGENTVLVVEMFGNTESIPEQSSKSSKVAEELPSQNALEAVRNTQVLSAAPFIASIKTMPLLDSVGISRSIGMFLLSFFIFVFLLDMIIVKRKKIVRVVGHNIDHILFLSTLIIFVILLTKGIVL